MDLKKWISSVYYQRGGDTKLSDVFFPGSHDSGAYGVLVYHENWARTQELSIYEQLCIGTRFLDLRITNYDGVYYVTHRFKYIPLATAMGDIQKFIGETDEFVIVSMVEDQNNRREFDKFFEGVTSSLVGMGVKFTTSFDGSTTLSDIYKDEYRILIPKPDSIPTIWPNTMSEDELMRIFKYMHGDTNKSGKIIRFDYVYTINAMYITSCYLSLVIPTIVFCSIIAHGIRGKYFRGNTHVIVSAISILIITFALSYMVPFISMPYLANNIKYFIKKNFWFVIPHIVSYDYVTKETNELIIRKNYFL